MLRKLLFKIRRAFYPLYSIPPESEIRGRDLVDCKAIVARHSRGNPSLQLGKFSTQEEIQSRKKSVCDFNFIDR